MTMVATDFSLGCLSLAQPQEGLGIKYQRKGAISRTGSPAGLWILDIVCKVQSDVQLGPLTLQIPFEMQLGELRVQVPFEVECRQLHIPGPRIAD